MRIEEFQNFQPLRGRDVEFPKKILAAFNPGEHLLMLDEADGTLEHQARRVFALLKEMSSMGPDIWSV